MPDSLLDPAMPEQQDTARLLRLVDYTEQLLEHVLATQTDRIANIESLIKITDTLARLAAVRKTLAQLQTNTTQNNNTPNTPNAGTQFAQAAEDLNAALVTTASLANTPAPSEKSDSDDKSDP